MRSAVPLAWVVLLAACGGGGGPSTGDVSVGGHFVAHPAITHVSVLQGGTIWWDCARAAADATSPSALSTGAQVQVRAYFDATPGASASLVDSCGGAIAPAGSSPGGGGGEAYATFDWTAPASPSACILTPRVTAPGPPAGPFEDAFPIVVRVGTPAAAHLRALASRLTAASGVSRVAAAVAGLTQDLNYVPADGTFSGTIASVPAGPQTVRATAYDAGSQPVGAGSGVATVVADATVPVSITVYDTTGPPTVPDHGPVVLALGVPSATATVGSSQTLSATAMDADAGDTITFAWSTTPDGCGTFSGSTATATSASTQWTAATAGTCSVKITVTSNGKTDERSADIVVVFPALAISPDPAIVAVNGTQQFTVAPLVPVTWSVTETVVAPVPPAYPLSASANGRYLVDRNGRPFLMVGDAAQSAGAALTYTEFQAYLDDRVARGFNTVNINIAEHYYAPSPSGGALTGTVPRNRNGDLPFLRNTSLGAYDGTGIADYSTPNDAYFALIESFVAYAETKGVLVSLQHYIGNGTHYEGWFNEIGGQTSRAVLTGFGAYLATGNGAFGGFASHPNIIWHWGGDWLFAEPSAEATRFHDMIDGLVSAGDAHLAYGDWYQGVSTQQVGFRTLMTMQAVYSYASMYATARSGYQYDPRTAGSDGRTLDALPTFLMETGYEGEIWAGAGDPASIRKFHWWSILSGATTGLIYGHRDVWEFANGSTYNSGFGLAYGRWQDSLNAPGARDMTRLAAFLGSQPWWRLVPSELSGMRLLVTSANGTQGATNYVSSAADPVGSLALAFVPNTGTSAQSLTVDLRQMAGTTQARWWNPTTGSYATIGTFANTASAQSFTTPGGNGTGANDWVLVLDLAAPRCGTISSAGLYTAPASVPVGVTCQVTAMLQSDPTVVAHALVSLPMPW